MWSTAPAQFLTFPCTASTCGWLFRCVYASLRKHLEKAPRALQKRKRKRRRECRLKEFIFTSLAWDCWFFFIHSICPLISLTLYLPPSPFISRLLVCLFLTNVLLGKAYDWKKRSVFVQANQTERRKWHKGESRHNKAAGKNAWLQSSCVSGLKQQTEP